MPHERLTPDRPEEWLNRAASDLTIARTRTEGVYLEDLCYHAQQCAEKSFKAVLLHRQGSFPFIHDLSELVNRVEKASIFVPEQVRAAVALTEFAVEGRYPNFDELVTVEQWQAVVVSAESVLVWARALIIIR